MNRSLAEDPRKQRSQLHSRESGRNLELTVGAKGEIEALDVSPGHYDVSLLNAGNFALQSIFHAQVAGQSLENNGPEDVQLRLMASKGSVQVEGLVFRNNQPAVAAMVVLAPQDPTNDRGLIRANLSASDGSFVFRDCCRETTFWRRDKTPWTSSWPVNVHGNAIYPRLSRSCSTRQAIECHTVELE